MQTSSVGLHAEDCRMVWSNTTAPMGPRAPSFLPCATTSLDVEGCTVHSSGEGSLPDRGVGNNSAEGQVTWDYTRTTGYSSSLLMKRQLSLRLGSDVREWVGVGLWVPVESSSAPEVRSRHLAPPLFSVASRQLIFGRKVSECGEKPLRSNEPSSVNSISVLTLLQLLTVLSPFQVKVNITVCTRCTLISDKRREVLSSGRSTMTLGARERRERPLSSHRSNRTNHHNR